ncbi:MAG: hypothetical protein M1834_009737 [Cirrosporium novae-zelandiae]|nr:MAG: hypothetical protein M1834_009737 [Cirrosporium novae-zelandiae]
MGEGWAWGPRSRRRAFGRGIGGGAGYVVGEKHQSQDLEQGHDENYQGRESSDESTVRGAENRGLETAPVEAAVWHIRFLNTILTQDTYYLLPFLPKFNRDSKPVLGPKHLFSYSVFQCSRTPFLEGDYNIHKSNSTYFADLDIARTTLVTRLFAKALGHDFKEIVGGAASVAAGMATPSTGTTTPLPSASLPNNSSTAISPPPAILQSQSYPHSNDTITKAKPGLKIYTALGGITCMFRKEIPLFIPYDIYTRVLTWDSKWMYFISFFVLRGTMDGVDVRRFVLQPWRNMKCGKGSRREKRHNSKDEKETKSHTPVLATSIARYVFKRNRLTIPPEAVIRVSGFRPSSSSFSSPSESGEEKWDLEAMERERVRGMQAVRDGWENLHEEFERGFGSWGGGGEDDGGVGEEEAEGREVLGIWGDWGIW